MTPKEAHTLRRSLFRQAKRATRARELFDARVCFGAAMSIRRPTTAADLAELGGQRIEAPTWTRRRFLGVIADFYDRPCVVGSVAFGVLRWDAEACRAVRV